MRNVPIAAGGGLVRATLCEPDALVARAAVEVSMVSMVSMVSSTRALAVVGELAGVDAVPALAHGLHAGVVAAMLVVATIAVAITVPVDVTWVLLD